MLSAGVRALDERLGGLEPRRFYLLTGEPGAGKTTLSLSFLSAGLEAGEICALITEDRGEDLAVQSLSLGLDFSRAMEEEQLLVYAYPAHFAADYAQSGDPRAVFQEMETMMRRHRPTRLVFDSLLPFLNGGHPRSDVLRALSEFLARLEATVYLTLPGALSDTCYRPLYDSIIAPAAGALHVQVLHQGARELHLRKFRREVVAPAPLRLQLVPGIGLLPLEGPKREGLTEGESRRLIVVDPVGALSEGTCQALNETFSVESFASVDQALPTLLEDRYGVLLLGVDPAAPQSAYEGAQRLRRMGNQGPLLFFSREEDPRRSTQIQAIRSGGDDFIAESLGVEEILSRIERAREHGHQSASHLRRVEPSMPQPLDAHGVALPLDRLRFSEMVAAQLRRTGSPSFVLVHLRTGEQNRAELFQRIAEQLRLAEGDRIAYLGEQDIGIYLHEVSEPDAEVLMGRALAGALGSFESTLHIHAPQEEESASWVSSRALPF